MAVGGTTLNIADSTGTYGSETAWSNSTGGFSSYEPEPAYQQIAQYSGGKSTPDVAYNANPSTGFAVYDSLADQGVRGWQVYGGTSAGTPQWAALIAIANQGRAQNGVGSLDGATGTLPTLYSLYTQANYFTNFHDETTGRSSFFTSARPGYDLVTGLGSPQANQVVQVLINSTTGASASTQAKTAAKIVARSQARRSVAIELQPQTQQPTAPIANSFSRQAVVEVQTFAHPVNQFVEIAPINFENAGNFHNAGNGFNSIHRASDFATQKSPPVDAIVGEFKFAHRASSKIISQRKVATPPARCDDFRKRHARASRSGWRGFIDGLEAAGISRWRGHCCRHLCRQSSPSRQRNSKINLQTPVPRSVGEPLSWRLLGAVHE